MNRFFSFLKTNKRYNRIIAGFVFGIFSFHAPTAAYAAAVAATCIQAKDYLRGCPWNWLDWALTIAADSLISPHLAPHILRPSPSIHRLTTTPSKPDENPCIRQANLSSQKPPSM